MADDKPVLDASVPDEPARPDGPDGPDETPEETDDAKGSAEGDPDEAEAEGAGEAEGRAVDGGPAGRRVGIAGVVIGLLLALLGFTLAVQVRSVATDETLATARQDDLVRILSDLESREERLRQDIAGLEASQRQLTTAGESREAALAEATRRADELGILSGTLPAIGPGLEVRIRAGGTPISAATLLDAIQELRGAGAEAMQVAGTGGGTVRVIASTSFVDADGGIVVDGHRLRGPYTISVIGEPQTMQTALNIPGGVVESVGNDGGTVTLQEPGAVHVSAVRAPTTLQHARPVT